MTDDSPSLTDSNDKASADDRELPVRLRLDLECRPARYGNHQYWTVKDPVSLRFFQLRDEEYFVLRQLDGGKSIGAIQAAFQHQFAPLRLSEDQLKAYISTLYRYGLVTADVPGQGARLFQRRRQQGRQSR